MISLIVAIVTCIIMIFLIIEKNSIQIGKREINTFWMAPLLGAIIILAFNILPINKFFENITANTSINPLKIIVLLMSISMLSITLDELGFFDYLACMVVRIVKNSQYKLFFILFSLIAVLTVFTSNDIVILTFTIFICYFAKNAKINPLPYLIMEFVVANTFSMIFVIGNPTNIYLASAYNINFLQYLEVMYLPTIFAGIMTVLMLILLFNNILKKPFEHVDIIIKPLKNKSLTICALIHLFAATVILAISNYINVEMWLISFVSAASLSVILIAHGIKNKDFNYIKSIYRKIPWNLALFVLSMFVIVLAIDYEGIFAKISLKLSEFIGDNKLLGIVTFGFTSTIADNLINNIPMSLAFSKILFNITSNQTAYVYATIIGSNIGAFLTPIGALAGIMWMNILRRQHVKLTFIRFSEYGLLLTFSILIAALLGLYLVL